jgi:hypothetical protein
MGTNAAVSKRTNMMPKPEREPLGIIEVSISRLFPIATSNPLGRVVPYKEMLVLALALALSAPSLDAKIASVVPQPTEDQWLTIPWRTNLMLARQESQRTGKPLFLWIMNGSPLGCT